MQAKSAQTYLSFYTAWADGRSEGREQSVNDERALRIRAREAMKAGSLPERPPERMWGGPGGGCLCAVCGRNIGKEEMEFELQFSSTEEGFKSYHVHVRCFAAWELERRSADSNDHLLPPRKPGGIINSCEPNGTNQGGGPG